MKLGYLAIAIILMTGMFMIDALLIKWLYNYLAYSMGLPTMSYLSAMAVRALKEVLWPAKKDFSALQGGSK